MATRPGASPPGPATTAKSPSIPQPERSFAWKSRQTSKDSPPSIAPQSWSLTAPSPSATKPISVLCAASASGGRIRSPNAPNGIKTSATGALRDQAHRISLRRLPHLPRQRSHAPWLHSRARGAAAMNRTQGTETPFIGITNFAAQIGTVPGARSRGRSCRACGVRPQAWPAPGAPPKAAGLSPHAL